MFVYVKHSHLTLKINLSHIEPYSVMCHLCYCAKVIFMVHKSSLIHKSAFLAYSKKYGCSAAFVGGGGGGVVWRVKGTVTYNFGNERERQFYCKHQDGRVTLVVRKKCHTSWEVRPT
jgi:hypothetical protein